MTIISLAGLSVLLIGLYFMALGALSWFHPARAVRFLESFAGSAFVHWAELSVRLAAGLAIVLYAPHLKFTGLFTIFGWVLIATTIGLLFVPWRRHRQFARWSVPFATRRIGLFGASSLVVGTFIITSVIIGRNG